MQILLVEDNKSITKALIYNLEQSNYKVLSAENIVEAQKILATEKIN